jgi:tetratricopeptide repeat protein
LDSVQVAPNDRRLQVRSGTLRADALAAAGKRDSARAVIQALLVKFPDNPRLKQQLERLR